MDKPKSAVNGAGGSVVTPAAANERIRPPDDLSVEIRLHERTALFALVPDEITPRLVRRTGDRRSVVRSPSACPVRYVVRRLATGADRPLIYYIESVVRIDAPAIVAPGIAREAERVASVPAHLDEPRVAPLAAYQLAHHAAPLIKDVYAHLCALRQLEHDLRPIRHVRPRRTLRPRGNLSVEFCRRDTRVPSPQLYTFHFTLYTSSFCRPRRQKLDLPPRIDVHECESARILCVNRRSEVSVRPRMPLHVHDGWHSLAGGEGAFPVRDSKRNPRNTQLQRETARSGSRLDGAAVGIRCGGAVEHRTRRDVAVVHSNGRVAPEVYARDARILHVLRISPLRKRPTERLVRAEPQLHQVAAPVAVLRTIRILRHAPTGKRHFVCDVEVRLIVHEEQRRVLLLGALLRVPAENGFRAVPVRQVAVDCGRAGVPIRRRATPRRLGYAVLARRSGERGTGEDSPSREKCSAQ